MADIAETLRQRVQALMPELEIEHFDINQEGLTNDVAIVNRKLVFRFAKTETSEKVLTDEMNILDLVRSRIGLEVPTPIYRSHDCVIYPYLEGQPFLRETWLKLERNHRVSTAQQIGQFLYRLHTTEISGTGWDVPRTLAPVTQEKWLEIRQRVRDKVYPLLLDHQIQWAENLFDSVLAKPESFEYHPSLIHGDLAPYHILFDVSKHNITGVIDFGVAGIGDPASDLGSLISSYGESFVTELQATYPNLDTLLPRARFYAQSIELQWVLLGVETGETFWFTAHVGGARDILC
ncbi:MAG TPA: phosphotransferase [Anaerolineales bacterium]|nr:phosphotransferase [Anaerolineales bacterium]